MAELSAVPFNELPSAHDGYTVLYENDKVCRSDVKLSELVGDISSYLTKEQADTLYQEKGDYLTEEDITGKLDKEIYAADSGTFLTAHQPISADEWNSCYETVSANSATWGSETDWEPDIISASENAYTSAVDWVEAQNYITGVDLSNYYTKQEVYNKEEVYTKQEVNDEIAKIGSYVVVEETAGDDHHPVVENPSTKVIYLTKIEESLNDNYKEWIYNADTEIFECIGETTLKLNDYYKKTETSSKQEIADALDTKQDVLSFDYDDTRITAINNSAVGEDWTEIIEEASANAVDVAVDTVENSFEYNENDEISAYNGSAFAQPEIPDCNSWKQWSEDHNCSANDDINVYIGAGNRVDDSIYSFDIGSTNTAENSKNSFNIGIGNKIVSGTHDADTVVNIGGYNEISGGFNATNIGYMNKNVVEFDKDKLSAVVTTNNKYAKSDFYTGSAKYNNTFPGGLNLGYGNYQVNPGINIGKSNITLTSYDYGDAINIGKYNINNYGVIIGQYNATLGYSFVLGEKSIANDGSFAYGKYASAFGGSYAFGDYTSANQGSITLGETSVSACGRSLAMGFDGVQGNGNAVAIGNHGVTAQFGGIAIGRNGVLADKNANGDSTGNAAIAMGSHGVWAYNGGIAVGSYGVTANNYHAMAVGHDGVLAENGTSLAIGGYGNTAKNDSIHIGVKGFADNRSIIINTNGSLPASQGQGNIIATNYSMVHNASNRLTQATASTGSIIIGAGKNTNAQSVRGSMILNAMSYDTNDPNRTQILTTAAQNSIIMITPSNDVDADIIHNEHHEYRETSIFNVENNSLLIGAGINGTVSVKNDSYLIGGNSRGNINGYVQNGSLVMGYNNMSDGGNYIIGHRNDAGGTIANSGTTAEVRPYNQAVILGNNNYVRNYKPYLYAQKAVFSGHKLFSAYISTDGYKSSRGNGSYMGQDESTIRNFIVGDYNRVTGYNAFVFGIGNNAGVPSYDYNSSNSTISGDKDDDGFTFTFGMHSHAVRNYDIAIGLGTTASGGENIAIGTKASYESYQPYYTVAKGYKNIAYHSYIEGILNVGFASDVPLTFDKNNESVYTNNIFNTVKNNYWNYSTLNFHDNRLDCVTGSNLGVQYNFNRNKLTYITNSTIGVSGSYGHFAYNDLFMCDYGTTISAQYASKNTIRCLSGAKFYGTNIHDNIFYNLGVQTYISAFNINQNIIFDEGVNSGGNTTIQINLSATNFDKNYVFNSELLGSAMGAGFNHNLIMYSKISADTNALSNGISYGYDTIGHSVLVGTNVKGQVTETFSFAASDTRSTDASAVTNAVLARVSKITNFGDNNIQNSYESQVFGEDNIVSSVGNSFIAGRKNLVQGPRNGYVVNNSNVTNNNVVFGDANAISNSDNAADEKFTNSIILGKANGIYKNCSDSKYYITDNTIIGSINGLYKIPTTAIDNVLTKGMYNWVEASAKFPYQNIIHKTNESFIASGKYLVNVYGGNESYNNARNLIMGSHSVISNNINDSTLIGSFNAAYNSATDVWSNNYVMGSFNLAANGSNQIVLGNSNIASGHNAMPIGEGLIANTSQTVFGRYNEVLDGTNGLSADDIDSKSGALLIVGNGRHILDKSDTASIERSNAMVVSANGTVSATRFATSGIADLEAKILELENIIAANSARWVLTNN